MACKSAFFFKTLENKLHSTLLCGDGGRSSQSAVHYHQMHLNEILSTHFLLIRKHCEFTF